MTLSPAMNTAATVGGYADKSAGVGDQLHPVAVPAELHHAGQPDAAGVTQRDGVAGALRVVEAVEAVGVGNALGRNELAEMKQHRSSVGALGVGVGLDDHRGQLCALVEVAGQRFGVPRLLAARVVRQL